MLEIKEETHIRNQFYYSDVFSVYNLWYLVNKKKDEIDSLIKDSYVILWSGPKKIFHEVNQVRIEIPKNHFIYLAPNKPQKFLENSMNTGSFLFVFKYEFYARTTVDSINLRNCFLFFNREKFITFQNNISNEIVFKHVFINPILAGADEKYFFRLKHNILERILLNGKIELNEKEIDVKDNDFDILLASKFKELLEENVAIEHKVSFYENKLFVTKRTLDKATLKLYNKKAKRMIIDELINKSKALLIHTNMQIKEIATELNFLQETNFTAFFKKNTGVSPKIFRESNNS